MLWPEGEDKELGEIKGIGSPLWKMGKIGRGCAIKEVGSWGRLWSLDTNWGATFYKKERKCCCKQCRERKGQNQQLWKKKMRVEYGLNKTGGRKATKACDLVCFLHFVLYFTVFPWHQVRSDCLLLSAPYVGCKCAGLFWQLPGLQYNRGYFDLSEYLQHLTVLGRAGEDVSSSVLSAGDKLFTSFSGIQGVVPKAYCRSVLLSLNAS